MQSNSSSWLELSKVEFPKLFSIGRQYAESWSNHLTYPFWKDILSHWTLFCKQVKIESINQIFESPLWLNANINSGKLFIKDWFQKGTKSIYDLIDGHGEWYAFEWLKVVCGIRGTFLDYLNVLNKIPNTWKDIINNNKVISILNKTNVRCSIYVSFVIKTKRVVEFSMISLLQ